jgi:hypothetical protein
VLWCVVPLEALDQPPVDVEIVLDQNDRLGVRELNNYRLTPVGSCS